MFRLFLVFVMTGILSMTGYAQETTVRGKFRLQTAKVGEQIPYTLVATHPSSQIIVFPDSSFAFAPFELENKTYYPTHTANGISIDSAVYYLSTYEIDSVQRLGLPVFIVNRMDCTTVYARPDTLFVNTVIKSIPESVEGKDLPLKTNTDYLNVKWLLNYPVLLGIAGVLLIILIVLWIVFGKRIRRYFLLRRLSKNHADFIDRFSRHIEKVRAGAAYAEAESALVDWKKYMESLLSAPYTKYTTKEILKLMPDEPLGQALREIDRMVYARAGSSPEAFELLRNYSQDQFTRKTQEVRHG